MPNDAQTELCAEIVNAILAAGFEDCTWETDDVDGVVNEFGCCLGWETVVHVFGEGGGEVLIDWIEMYGKIKRKTTFLPPEKGFLLVLPTKEEIWIEYSLKAISEITQILRKHIKPFV